MAIKKQLLCLFAILFQCCLIPNNAMGAVQCSIEKRTPKVALIIPTTDENSFFDRVVQLTKVASEQLNVELRVHYYNERVNNRFYYANFIDEILVKETDNDYIVGLFFSMTEEKVIEVINKHKVKFFSFNSPLSPAVKRSIGTPREFTSLWIGHLSPNDEQVGYDLTEELIRENLSDEVSLIAINGSRNSEVASMRSSGLLTKLASEPKIKLLQLLYTDWSYEQTREKTKLILSRFDEIDAVWAASDTLARAFIDETQIVAPERLNSIKVSSIDWSPEILPYVKNKQVSTSYGGHVFEGVWIIAMIYDHFNGYDFEQELGATILYSLSPITSSEIIYLTPTYNQYFQFKKLSKCQTHTTNNYEFNAKKLIQDVQHTLTKKTIGHVEGRTK